MGDSEDCLIDLNSPVPNDVRASLTPSVLAYQNGSLLFPDFGAPPLLEDNNPFDLVVRMTEINEADKNDPFEMAFETACGYQVEITNSEVAVDPTTSGKSTEALPENLYPEECINGVPDPIDNNEEIDDINLDSIQPPDFLVNSSFDLSDHDNSITINDTLHLSSMSDMKFSPGEKIGSPFLEKNPKTDDLHIVGCDTSMSSRSKIKMESETPKITVSPLHFPTDTSTSDKSGSFEESPTKALCAMKTDECLKSLIENRIKKCIAKALNDSHQQFRNSVLLEAGNTTFEEKSQPKGKLRASLSVPQNLHLLHNIETCEKSEQTTDDKSPISSTKQKILEDLNILAFDHSIQTARRSINRSFDIVTSKTEILTSETTGNQSKRESISNEKLSQFRAVIDAQLQQNNKNYAAPPAEVETDLKPISRRRSLSCGVALPPQPITKGSSPPKLPPLPLSSDTIRDLSLCSKYSPTKPKEGNKSPGNAQAKLSTRPVPLPVCAQPKLVLRKKQTVSSNGPVTATGTFSGLVKGPMKAIVPVKNMTRFAAGSPRPSVQSQNKRGSVASSKQSSLDSPSMQKARLCPLAASTPSNPPALDKAGSTRAQPVISVPPPRRILSGIPSPSRRGSTVPSANPNVKPDTPTRRSSISAFGRGVSNPRVLLDKNGLTSASVTPVRKSRAQLAAHTQARNHPQVSDKENMGC